MSKLPAFRMPPVTDTSAGGTRRVGFELEFGGLTMESTSAAVHDALGGELVRRSAAEATVEVDGLGLFQIEVDWAFLKRAAAEIGADDTDAQRLMDWLADAATAVVPLEVVCPPIPMDRLDAIDPMVSALRAAGAVGTDDSPLAAYGVHVNIELPDLEAGTIHAYLRAFGLLQWWLGETHQVDLTRKITPYIDPYPEAYLRLLATKREVGIDAIFDHYLEHNDTRNRALDLLPLLAEIDAGRVRAVVDDDRIKPRPAFHYRLPNCHIEQPHWSLKEAWNGWWVVEQLASREADLARLADAFLRNWRPVLGFNRSAWLEHIDAWLTKRGLA